MIKHFKLRKNLKKKQRVVLILSFLLASIVFNSCSPYENGPSFSFSKAEKRIIGKWEITDILVNDKTDHLLLLKEKDFEYTFNQDGSFEKINKSKNRIFIDIKSRWSFKENKTILLIENYISEDDWEIVEKFEYEILKLSNKELWIKDNETPSQISFSDYIVERHYTKK